MGVADKVRRARCAPPCAARPGIPRFAARCVAFRSEFPSSRALTRASTVWQPVAKPTRPSSPGSGGSAARRPDASRQRNHSALRPPTGRTGVLRCVSVEIHSVFLPHAPRRTGASPTRPRRSREFHHRLLRAHGPPTRTGGRPLVGRPDPDLGGVGVVGRPRPARCPASGAGGIDGRRKALHLPKRKRGAVDSRGGDRDLVGLRGAGLGRFGPGGPPLDLARGLRRPRIHRLPGRGHGEAGGPFADRRHPAAMADGDAFHAGLGTRVPGLRGVGPERWSLERRSPTAAS